VKAVVVLNDGDRFKRGDIIAWGCVDYNVESFSAARIDPDDPESELLYGECQLVEYTNRPTVNICEDTQPNIDMKQLHTWNFDEERIELKTDPESRKLIFEEFKKHAKNRIECTERKLKRMDKSEKKDKEKNDIDNCNNENQIRKIVSDTIQNEPTDPEVERYQKNKLKNKINSKRRI
jgi:hypothetical protein